MDNKSGDDDEIQGQYSDGNRAFLQALMSRGTMTFREAAPVLAAIFSAQEQEAVSPDQVSVQDMESYVAAASAAISAFDLEIRSARHQVTKERVWAVVNTTSDGLTQMATLHSAEEIAFVKRVIDAMFEKYNTPRIEAMCLDSMQANKLRVPGPTAAAQDTTMMEVDDGENDDGQPQQMQQQTLKGMKSSEAEAVMHSMVDEGWFEKTKEGLYMLSSRALLELRTWLVDMYNDLDAEQGEWRRIKQCEACREIVTMGKRCPERDCLVRLHEICEEPFWRTRRDRTCPKCRTAWPADKASYVGPKAITETEAYQRGRRRSGKGRNSNLVEQIMHDEEEEEVEGAAGEEEEDDEE